MPSPSTAPDTNTLTVPDEVRVWWTVNRPHNMAKVVKVEPYVGCYPDYFTHVLTLDAPNTRRGTVEMDYDARHPSAYDARPLG
jgi:hypothetical protein